MKKILLSLFIIVITKSSFAGLAITPTQLWTFGDSFSDTDNQKALLGTFPPDPPYFNGRLSNGPVWIEGVASSLGLTANASLLFGMPFTEATNISQAGAPTDSAGT